MRYAILFTASLGLAACGGSAEVETERVASEDESASYALDEKDGGTTLKVETDDGEAVMRNGKDITVNLPKDFTIYEGAEVVSNTVFEQGESKGALIVLESEAAPEVMAAHYRAEAENAGIEIKMEMSVNDGKMIGGEGSDGSAFSFNANREEDTTVAQLMVGENFGK